MLGRRCQLSLSAAMDPFGNEQRAVDNEQDAEDGCQYEHAGLRVNQDDNPGSRAQHTLGDPRTPGAGRLIRNLPAGFAVSGREAQERFMEFEAPFSGFLPEPRDYKVQIQARIDHREAWRPLLTFTLKAANIIYPDRYTVDSNAPA